MPHRRVCLPLDQWPAVDRTRWVNATREKGLFDAPHAGANWSPLSRRKTASGYGRWLAWLIGTDAYDPAEDPGRRATPEQVAAYLRDLEPMTAPYTLLCRVQELYDAMRVLAPDHNWSWLAQLYRTLRSRAKPVRDK